ncbi:MULTISPECIES: methylamine utilization protein [Rosistilla]|uniref:Methylamine utilization protein n=2 Tax=Rosistilla TaxID=2795779 RepID=A0A518IPK1_9BACT|nr:MULTISPECIES: methylamine utilization protein [Rosistilla]QDS86784.1 hypothetical protein EC9_09580 [Rosistilla ulvae]QDV55019.1 hypothetical protein Mal33_09870 [Rosistilla oblonga]
MRFLIISAFVATTFLSATADAQQWGDLKVKFVFKGAAPDADKIAVTVDKEFCGKHDLVDESLVVGKDGGIQNVVVYAYDGRGGVKLPAIHPDLEGKPNTHELANKDCRFEPHIVICKAGDTLNVTNPDPVGHNCNLAFLVNAAQNFTIPPLKSKEVKLDNAEPAPIPVACNIHPWMQAKVVVLEHPYAAKSDESGTLVIKNLPTGKLAFRLYHEAAGRLSGLEVAGSEVNRRNVFEVEIKPGENDLGTVELDAKLF